MYQNRNNIEVMNCVRYGRGAAGAVEGTAARKQYVQDSRHDSERHSMRRAGQRNERVSASSGRKSIQGKRSGRGSGVSRAEIIDFRDAAGYTIPEPTACSAGRREANRRRNARTAAGKKTNPLRHSAMMLLTGLLLGILLTLAAGIITRASSVSVPAAYKYYDTISVQSGETSEDIISRYMDPLHYETREAFTEELCSINGLEKDSAGIPLLHPGVHLIVPYYSEDVLY